MPQLGTSQPAQTSSHRGLKAGVILRRLQGCSHKTLEACVPAASLKAPGHTWRLHTASAKGPPNWDCQMGKMAARASTTGPLLSSLRAVRCTSPAAPPATACSACKRPTQLGLVGTMAGRL